MAVQDASKSSKYFKTRKINLLVFENLENLINLNQNLDSNWHWLKMRKKCHFLIKNEFQRPRFGGSFWSQKVCPFCRGVRILIYGNRFRAGYSGLTAGFAGKNNLFKKRSKSARQTDFFKKKPKSFYLMLDFFNKFYYNLKWQSGERSAKIEVEDRIWRLM